MSYCRASTWAMPAMPQSLSGCYHSLARDFWLLDFLCGLCGPVSEFRPTNSPTWPQSKGTRWQLHLSPADFWALLAGCSSWRASSQGFHVCCRDLARSSIIHGHRLWLHKIIDIHTYHTCTCYIYIYIYIYTYGELLLYTHITRIIIDQRSWFSGSL